MNADEMLLHYEHFVFDIPAWRARRERIHYFNDHPCYFPLDLLAEHDHHALHSVAFGRN